MSYSAIICKLENVRKHPNADRLKMATIFMEDIIIGLENENGELGVLFPSDGVLSKEMAHHNNLYRHPELNEDKEQKGLFDDIPRVRCQKIRNEKSNGFWMPLKSLKWTGVDVNSLEEGFEFTALNGKKVCEKYTPPRKGNKNTNQKKSKHRRSRIFGFRQHFDTKHLRREIKKIEGQSLLYLTYKAHGTSARTGHLLVEKTKDVGPIRRWWYKHFRGNRLPTEKHWRIVIGTRRVDFDPFALDAARTSKEYLTTYGGSNRDYRVKASRILEKLGIPKQYTVYYEIVGYELSGKPIMPSSSTDKIDDKKLQKQIKKLYGEKMNYSYGCRPLNARETYNWYTDKDYVKDPFRILVYRVTFTNEDGLQEDLSWPQVKRFCADRALETVVEAHPEDTFPKAVVWENYEIHGNFLINLIEMLCEGPDPLDSRHIKEGICVRIEHQKRTYILKDKTWIFRQLEQVNKDAGIVDTEEEEENNASE